MFAKSPIVISIGAGLSLMLSACGTENKANYRKGTIGAPVEAEAVVDKLARVPVNFKLPNRKFDPAAGALTGYYYRLKGSGEACPTTENKEEVGAYVDDKEFILKLANVCDYTVTIKLGVLAAPALTATLNFSNNIKSILQSNCVSCHETYGDYAEVKAKGALIVSRVEAGTMPQAGALSDDDIAKFLAWKDGGYLEKDPSPAPSEKESGLSAIYYRNNNNDSLKGVELKSRSQYELRRSLWLQAEGQSHGLKVNELFSFENESISAP